MQVTAESPEMPQEMHAFQWRWVRVETGVVAACLGHCSRSLMPFSDERGPADTFPRIILFMSNNIHPTALQVLTICYFVELQNVSELLAVSL